MDLQVGVKILLQNKKGKYLLVKRNPAKYPEVRETWDIVGGRIDPGSSLLKNLRREVKEEVGMELSGKPKLIAAQDILRIPGKHVVRLTYTGKAVGEPRLCGDEHVEVRWFSRRELEALEGLDQYLREILKKVLSVSAKDYARVDNPERAKLVERV